MPKHDRIAEQLAALGHPVRLATMTYVAKRGASGAAAGDVQAHVKAAASTLSHHLKRLVDAGLLVTREEGTFHFYNANHDALAGLAAFVTRDLVRKKSK